MPAWMGGVIQSASRQLSPEFLATGCSIGFRPKLAVLIRLMVVQGSIKEERMVLIIDSEATPIPMKRLQVISGVPVLLKLTL